MTPFPGSGGYPVTRRGRWLLAGWSFVLISGFGLAFSVTPDPRGFGTHQQLGLPPCSFRELFKIPCPSCGMTTSFCQLMHGNIAAACRASASGVLVALVCAVQIPWCWWSAAQGRLAGVSDPERTLLWLLSSLGIVCLLYWALRLIQG